MFTQASTHSFHFDGDHEVFEDQLKDIAILNNAFMYSTIKHGDFINDQYIWDEHEGAVPLGYELTDHGHVPSSIKIGKFSPIDPYHWDNLSDYFWLTDDLKKALVFVKDHNGHFVARTTINYRDYVVIVDDPELLVTDDRVILHPDKMVFMTEEREFEGPIVNEAVMVVEEGKRFKTNRTYPTYEGVPCFFMAASEEPLEFQLSRPTIWSSSEGSPLQFGDLVIEHDEFGNATYKKWDGQELYDGTPVVTDDAPIPHYGPYHWDLFQLDDSDFTLADSIMKRMRFAPIGDDASKGFFAFVTINDIEYVCLSSKAPQDNRFTTVLDRAFTNKVRYVEQDKHHYEEPNHPNALTRYVKRHYFVWCNRPVFFTC